MEEMDTEDTSGTATAAAAAAAAAANSDGTTPATIAQPYTLKQLLTAPDLRRPLFIACMLQVIQQFSGINAVRPSLRIDRLSSQIFSHPQTAGPRAAENSAAENAGASFINARVENAEVEIMAPNAWHDAN